MQLAETRHAMTRRQQRSIPAEAVDLLWRYGCVERHRGADCLFFDRAGRRRAEAALEPEEFRRH